MRPIGRALRLEAVELAHQADRALELWCVLPVADGRRARVRIWQWGKLPLRDHAEMRLDQLLDFWGELAAQAALDLRDRILAQSERSADLTLASF